MLSFSLLQATSRRSQKAQILVVSCPANKANNLKKIVHELTEQEALEVFYTFGEVAVRTPMRTLTLDMAAPRLGAREGIASCLHR